MANDSNELKNNAPCEEKQETHKLTEEELEQVNGGARRDIIIDVAPTVIESKEATVR